VIGQVQEIQEMAIRLMCVDDNELIAAAIQHHVLNDGRFAWVGATTSADDLLEQVTRSSPDVLLLDIDMPGRSAFEALEELAAVQPNVRVLVFSGYVQGDYLDRAIDAGAWGYASKNDPIDEVMEAIQRVASGEFALTPEVGAEQQRRIQSLVQADHDG
jgi:two-component system response regulator DesR